MGLKAQLGLSTPAIVVPTVEADLAVVEAEAEKMQEDEQNEDEEDDDDDDDDDKKTDENRTDKNKTDEHKTDEHKTDEHKTDEKETKTDEKETKNTGNESKTSAPESNQALTSAATQASSSRLTQIPSTKVLTGTSTIKSSRVLRTASVTTSMTSSSAGSACPWIRGALTRAALPTGHEITSNYSPGPDMTLTRISTTASAATSMTSSSAGSACPWIRGALTRAALPTGHEKTFSHSPGPEMTLTRTSTTASVTTSMTSSSIGSACPWIRGALQKAALTTGDQNVSEKETKTSAPESNQALTTAATQASLSKLTQTSFTRALTGTSTMASAATSMTSSSAESACPWIRGALTRAALPTGHEITSNYSPGPEMTLTRISKTASAATSMTSSPTGSACPWIRGALTRAALPTGHENASNYSPGPEMTFSTLFTISGADRSSSSSAAAAAAGLAKISASIAAARPHETAYHTGGSALCNDISRDVCIQAFQQFVNAIAYSAYTSYVASAGGTFINFWLGGNQGCTAKYWCDSNAAYAAGMNNVEKLFEGLYSHDDVNPCGTSDLSNGCHVGVDMCDDCVPHIPCFALPASDVQAGRPCYGQFADGIARTCKFRTVSCGRAGVCGRSCTCDDGSKPEPFIEPVKKLYTCPDVEGLPGPPPGWPFVA